MRCLPQRSWTVLHDAVAMTINGPSYGLEGRLQALRGESASKANQ